MLSKQEIEKKWDQELPRFATREEIYEALNTFTVDYAILGLLLDIRDILTKETKNRDSRTHTHT